MTIIRFSTIALFAALTASAAMAQDSATEFRLAPASNNIAGCTNLDASLSRVHTFSIKDGAAQVKSSGGVDDKMKLVRPGVYATEFALGGVRLDILADLSASPKSLTVTEKNRGCKWLATAP